MGLGKENTALTEKEATARRFTLYEEGFLADTVADIDWLLQSKGISRKQLAELTDVSEQRISRIFSQHGGNLTLRTVARIFAAIDEDVRLTSTLLERLRRECRHGNAWPAQRSSKAPCYAALAERWLAPQSEHLPAPEVRAADDSDRKAAGKRKPALCEAA